MSNRARRIRKELKDLREDPLSNIEIKPVEDDLTHLTGFFTGPPDTPYEGGRFSVDIQIPQEYPFRPPMMKFNKLGSGLSAKVPVWHPNVSSDSGAICLDTLSTGWSPILTIKSALMMLQSLLSSPEPRDPQDAVVAKQFQEHPIQWKITANKLAHSLAGAPLQDYDQGGSGGATNESLRRSQREAKERKQKDNLAEYHGYNKDLIDRFCAMGFDVPAVVAAFEYVGIDRMDGQDYELEEAYMGDITARLFGEP